MSTKNIIKNFCFLFLCICFLCACQNKSQDANISEENQVEKQHENVSLIVNDKSTMEEENEDEEKELELESEKKEEKTPEEILEEKIQEKLSSMTIEEKVAQLFIITPEALTGYGSVTQAGNATLEAISKYPVGGLIYFNGNIVSEEQLKEMISSQQEYSMNRIGLPLFISVDEEGGKVTRIASSGLNVPTYSYIATLGAEGDTEVVYRMGRDIGKYLSEFGFNLDFAPVADVITNSENNVVKERSYGSDGTFVSKMVIQQLKGLQDEGVYGCLKHFPGHGGTSADSHNGYAYTSRTWEELKNEELVPFIEGIEAGAKFVMVGHISTPNITGDEIPASCSKKMISDYLRGELNYDDIVLTDALNMKAITNQYSSSEAAVKVFLAGADIILMPADFNSAYEGIINAVESGEITKERLDESVLRILQVKMNMLND